MRASFVDRRLGREPIGVFLSDLKRAADIKPLFGHQLRDLMSATRGDGLRLDAVVSAVQAVCLIESCYAHRQPLPAPWARIALDCPLLPREVAD